MTKGPNLSRKISVCIQILYGFVRMEIYIDLWHSIPKSVCPGQRIFSYLCDTEQSDYIESVFYVLVRKTWCLFYSERTADKHSLSCLALCDHRTLQCMIVISTQVWGIGSFILTWVSPQPSYIQTKSTPHFLFMYPSGIVFIGVGKTGLNV